MRCRKKRAPANQPIGERRRGIAQRGKLVRRCHSKLDQDARRCVGGDAREQDEPLHGLTSIARGRKLRIAAFNARSIDWGWGSFLVANISIATRWPGRCCASAAYTPSWSLVPSPKGSRSGSLAWIWPIK